VTERFALKTKYFYDEQNLEAFREEYAAMPIHEKAMENRLLTAGGVVTVAVLLLGILVIVGAISVPMRQSFTARPRSDGIQ